MTEDEYVFVELLKILINDIESGEWTLRDSSFNVENDYEYLGIEPIHLKAKIYNIQCELRF